MFNSNWCLSISFTCLQFKSCVRRRWLYLRCEWNKCMFVNEWLSSLNSHDRPLRHSIDGKLKFYNNAHCTMHIALSTLHYAHNTMHIALCTLHHAHCTMHSTLYITNFIFHIASYTFHFSYYSWNLASYMASYTLHLSHCIVHIVLYKLHLTHCILQIASHKLNLTNCIIHPEQHHIDQSFHDQEGKGWRVVLLLLSNFFRFLYSEVIRTVPLFIWWVGKRLVILTFSTVPLPC